MPIKTCPKTIGKCTAIWTFVPYEELDFNKYRFVKTLIIESYNPTTKIVNNEHQTIINYNEIYPDYLPILNITSLCLYSRYYHMDFMRLYQMYYNPPNLKLSDEVFHILRKNCAEYIIMGDLNAKTTLWCSDKNNDNGDILDNIMLDNDCIIANSKEPIHKNFNGKTTSILDYFIISTKLFDYVEDCMVFSDEDMTSDNFTIFLKLSLKRSI